jgi:GntR family transcriptional regulator
MSIMQSSDRILAYVEEAGLKVGDQLPAEVEMAKLLGISRNSVREAYAKLTTRGILLRRHGIGTFLSQPMIINDFGDRRGFWRMIELSGFTPSLHMLSLQTVALDHPLAASLKPSGRAPVTLLEWLFRADGQPVIYIQHAISPSIRIDHVDWSKVRNILAAVSDQVQDGELEILNSATKASRTMSRHLEIAEGSALLYGETKVHLADGQIPISSRYWGNPRYTAITHRQPITRQQFET